MNRSWFARRNLPELGEPAEMIEADIVKIVRDPAHPVDPPRISLLLHHVPAIKRIAPALAVCAEKIRRHAGDDFGIEFGIQAKQIGMSPDIGAIEIYEDRDVAHDPNRMLRAIGSQRLPLLEEKELHGASHIEFVEHLRVLLVQRHRIAVSQFTGPAIPAFQLETRAQAIEENKVIEPPLILPAEVLVAGAGVRGSGAHEVACRFKQQRQLPVENRWVVHGPGTATQRVDPSAVNPAAISEPLQADQQRISSKGRSGGIRRVPVTERTERQHLPQALPRGGKKIRERICRRTKVANPTARTETRQAASLQEGGLNSATNLLAHAGASGFSSPPDSP